MGGVLTLCRLWYPRLEHYIGDEDWQKNRSTILITLCVTECLLFVMATAIPQFEPFDIHAEGAIAQRWRKWIKRRENLFVVAAISDKKRQRALLLYYAGEEVSKIFDTLPDTGEDFETAKTKLNAYFDPKKNVEIFTLRSSRWDLHVSASEAKPRRNHELVALPLATVSSYLWIYCPRQGN